MTYMEILDLSLFLIHAFNRSFALYLDAADEKALDHCRQLNEAAKIVTNHL